MSSRFPIIAILGFTLLLVGCASHRQIRMGNPSLPSAAISGSRTPSDRIATIARIVKVDGEKTNVSGIWKDTESRTEIILPAGLHSLHIEAREHMTFNEACVAFGETTIQVELKAGKRYYARCIIIDNNATVDIVDLATFEPITSSPSIPVKRGFLTLPVRLD